jgi:hypothetical protein
MADDSHATKKDLADFESSSDQHLDAVLKHFEDRLTKRLREFEANMLHAFHEAERGYGLYDDAL